MLSDNLKNLLESLLNYDPALRPTIADILSHPWMKEGPVATKEETADELKKRFENRERW